jgi:aspartate aminotransferase-like enzyme
MKWRFIGALAAVVVCAAPGAAQAAQKESKEARAPARPSRWQLALSDGSYLWDLRLVRLDNDTLVVTQSDSTVRVPLQRIDELRRIRGSEELGAPAGASDQIFRVNHLSLEDRRRVVQTLVAAYASRGTAPHPPERR